MFETGSPSPVQDKIIKGKARYIKHRYEKQWIERYRLWLTGGCFLRKQLLKELDINIHDADGAANLKTLGMKDGIKRWAGAGNTKPRIHPMALLVFGETALFIIKHHYKTWHQILLLYRFAASMNGLICRYLFSNIMWQQVRIKWRKKH